MIAEETFSWLSRYKKAFNSMPKTRFEFSLHRLIKHRNLYTEYCYRVKKYPLLPSIKKKKWIKKHGHVIWFKYFIFKIWRLYLQDKQPRTLISSVYAVSTIPRSVSKKSWFSTISFYICQNIHFTDILIKYKIFYIKE